MSALYQNYIPVVEQAIQQLGVPIEQARTAQNNHWRLKRNSADILIYLKETHTITKERKGLLLIISPVVKLPEDTPTRCTLLEELLSANHEMSIANFSIRDGFAYIKATRFVDGMDVGEVTNLLNVQSASADYFDDILQNKYHKNNS